MPAIRLVRARRNAVAATRRPTVLAKRDQAGLRTTQSLRPTPLHNPRQNTADLILATETAARTPLSVIRRKIFTLSGGPRHSPHRGTRSGASSRASPLPPQDQRNWPIGWQH